MRTTLLAVFLGLLSAGPALGQTFDFDPERLWRERPEPVYTDLALLTFADAPDYAALRGAREPRLFRMPTRWLDDNTDLEPSGGLAAASDLPDDDGRFQLVIGAHNPHLDMRRSGDIGGLGYQRFATQILLAGAGATTLHLHLQAVTPAGPECDGLAHGPSVIFPSLCGYHDLGDGSALIGFIGKPARASFESLECLNSNIRYGLAFQQPLLDPMPGLKQQVYFFVEALGHHRLANDLGTAPPGGWEIIPGIHWHSGDRCWLSGGLLVPFGGTRPETGIWQITCSWRF